MIPHMSRPYALAACVQASELKPWVCGLRVLLVVVSILLPPPHFLFVFFSLYLFCFVLLFFFFLKMENGAPAHCRHRHGQLVQRCCSVAFSGVRRRCFVGGRAPGVRLARLDVHGYGSGWVWLVVFLLLVLAG